MSNYRQNKIRSSDLADRTSERPFLFTPLLAAFKGSSVNSNSNNSSINEGSNNEAGEEIEQEENGQSWVITQQHPQASSSRVQYRKVYNFSPNK